MISSTPKMSLPVDSTVNSSNNTGTPPQTFGRTMSAAEPVENDDQEQDKENKCPNHDERKRVQKRARDEEDKSVKDGAGEKSPSKVLLPRQLVYPDDDVLGTIAALAEDDQEEVPATQPYPSEQEDAKSQSVRDGDAREEGECSPESQIPIAG